MISQAAFDLIVQEETGGRAYYEQRQVHPDWPGGASGVTVGIGYDCGYCTANQLTSDWTGIIPDSMIIQLRSVAGIKGSPAHSSAQLLHAGVMVPWASALKVFQNIDVPRWTNTVLKALPNADKLTGDCLGALVSLAFNRGASFTLPGDRYREMRTIKALMEAQNFAAIPAEFRSMKRIWPLNTPGHTDLTNRREHEAALFEKGLNP